MANVDTDILLFCKTTLIRIKRSRNLTSSKRSRFRLTTYLKGLVYVFFNKSRSSYWYQLCCYLYLWYPLFQVQRDISDEVTKLNERTSSIYQNGKLKDQTTFFPTLN
jgi:hypothetical protein